MRVVPTVVAVVLATTLAVAQEKLTREGISNYTKVDAVVACGGATETSALDGLKALLREHDLEHVLTVTYHAQDRVVQQLIW